MDAINLAIELGKAIQADERYINYRIASQKNDEDEELQSLIEELNLKKLAINNEISKSNKSEEKINSLNEEMRACYLKIIDNGNMKTYQTQKFEFDKFISQINKIIAGAAQGEDPELISIENNEGACSGNCGTCGGCH